MDICDVCFVDKSEKQLPCNHRLCHACSGKVDKCPFCRATLAPRINLVMKDLIEWYDEDVFQDGYNANTEATLANYLFHMVVPLNFWFKTDLGAKAKHAELYNPRAAEGIFGSGKYYFTSP